MFILQPRSYPSTVVMFMTNNNAFQPVNNHANTSAITIPAKTQKIKQPYCRLVPESEKMKKKAKTQKQITVAFPTTSEDSPTI